MKQIKHIPITQDILNAIAEFDEFKGAWLLYGKLTPDRRANLQRVALAQTITQSMFADGYQVSESQVMRVLNRLNADSFDMMQEQLIAGYAFASKELQAHYAHMPFSQASIQQLHRWLSRYLKNGSMDAGRYKQRPNHVMSPGGDGSISCVIAQTALPYETESEMDDLVYVTVDALNARHLHPLQVIAHFVGRFLHIQPFQDHNHALLQLVMQQLLLQQGYQFMPYGAIGALHTDIEILYTALRRAYHDSSAHEQVACGWMRLFMRTLLDHKRKLQEKVAREQTLNLHVSDYAATVLGLIQEHGKLSLSDLVRLTGFNKHTTKKHVQELVKKQQVIMHGKARATWYTIL